MLNVPDFYSFFLLEKLRIVKKSSQKSKETNKHHQSDMDSAKKDFESSVIGKVKGKTVKKSRHMSQVRDGDTLPRDHGVSNEDILEIVEKALNHPNYKHREKLMVVYKNKKGRYDLLVMSVQRNLITLITIIRENKRMPVDYFTPKHKDRVKLVVESQEMQELDLKDDYQILVID